MQFKQIKECPHDYSVYEIISRYSTSKLGTLYVHSRDDFYVEFPVGNTLDGEIIMEVSRFVKSNFPSKIRA